MNMTNAFYYSFKAGKRIWSFHEDPFNRSAEPRFECGNLFPRFFEVAAGLKPNYKLHFDPLTVSKSKGKGCLLIAIKSSADCLTSECRFKDLVRRSKNYFPIETVDNGLMKKRGSFSI